MTKAKKQPKQPKAKSLHVFKPIVGSEAIIQAIKNVERRGKQFDKDVHNLALSVMLHADKFGDVTHATNLVKALPKGTRSNAMKDWFIHFGKFKWNAETKSFNADHTKETRIAEATAKPFYEFNAKEGADYVPYDLVTALQKVWAQASKAKARGDALPEAIMQQLEGMVQSAKDPLAEAA